jgi:hypothetical protein
MEFLVPIIIIGAMILVPIGFLLARRDTGRGANPEDPIRQGE